MNKFDTGLNFDEIRGRIELDFGGKRSKDWADLIGVGKSLISNIHGKSKKQNPPLPYIIAVARVTGKPIEWYLYGEKPENQTVQKVAELRAQYQSEEEFMARWPEDIKNACRQLRDILLSDHPVIKPALLSNLAAFQYSLEKEKSQDEEAKKLKRRLLELEHWRKAKQDTGTEDAASSSTGKSET